MEKPIQPCENWGPEALAHWKSVLSEWQVEKDRLAILFVATDSLDRYHKARKQLENSGLVFKTANQIKKHPLCEVCKNERQGFIQSMKALGLDEGETTGQVGRPTDFESFQKRGRL
jgi:hypothetical protein